MLNSVVRISMMSAKYFEYYTIILRGAVFSWTHYDHQGCLWYCILHIIHVSLNRSTRLQLISCRILY